MALVLVTGGTGTLGRHLVPRLQSAGHAVRVMSRTGGTGGTGVVRGDLITGEGLDDALAGVDTVVHAATDPVRARRVEVEGTRRLIERMTLHGRSHLVYVSIVGVDRHALRYYKAKWAAEQLIERSGLPWTILRAVQFHELLDKMFTAMRPVIVTPRGFRFQPVAAAEAAERLVDLVGGDGRGRVADLGGPEVRDMSDLALVWKRARGSRKPIIRPPMPGRIAGAFRRGMNLAPDHAEGRVTWEEWLAGAHDSPR